MINGSLRNSPRAFFSGMVNTSDTLAVFSFQHCGQWHWSKPCQMKSVCVRHQRDTLSVRIKTSTRRKWIEKCYLVFKIMSHWNSTVTSAFHHFERGCLSTELKRLKACSIVIPVSVCGFVWLSVNKITCDLLQLNWPWHKIMQCCNTIF